MKNELEKLSHKYGIQFIPPAPADLREEAFSALEMPEPLRQFYNITNGITHEWFRIPPISDPDRIKKTWNSIQRINGPSTSKCLAAETGFLKRFLIFAELSGPDYGVFDRKSGTIRYSEGDDFYETDLDLVKFISTALREVDELLSYNKHLTADRVRRPLKGALGVINFSNDPMKIDPIRKVYSFVGINCIIWGIVVLPTLMQIFWDLEFSIGSCIVGIILAFIFSVIPMFIGKNWRPKNKEYQILFYPMITIPVGILGYTIKYFVAF
jgi:hypothetical protein